MISRDMFISVNVTVFYALNLLMLIASLQLDVIANGRMSPVLRDMPMRKLCIFIPNEYNHCDYPWMNIVQTLLIQLSLATAMMMDFVLSVFGIFLIIHVYFNSQQTTRLRKMFSVVQPALIFQFIALCNLLFWILFQTNFIVHIVTYGFLDPPTEFSVGLKTYFGHLTHSVFWIVVAFLSALPMVFFLTCMISRSKNAGNRNGRLGEEAVYSGLSQEIPCIDLSSAGNIQKSDGSRILKAR